MAQGDLISLTILNMVVDKVVRNWVKAMVEGADDQSGCGQESRHPNPLF